jgi:chemotaxis protein methyltransferase CheR
MNITPPLTLRRYLLDKIGLSFDEKRKKVLEKAIEKRSASIGLKSFRDYFRFLNSTISEEEELKKLILFLTIGESTFFRSPDQFKALRDTVLPELKNRLKGSPIRIWSAGCSTGEEPYSIAIVARELQERLKCNVDILATDINSEYLEHAMQGVYDFKRLRYVDMDFGSGIINKYFRRDGRKYAITQLVKELVDFQFANLANESHFQKMRNGQFQVIFCRNVFIYFQRGLMSKVIDLFNRLLDDNGYLFLGFSETLMNISESFEAVQLGEAFIYRKLPKGVRRELLIKAIRPSKAVNAPAPADVVPPKVRLPAAPAPESADAGRETAPNFRRGLELISKGMNEEAEREFKTLLVNPQTIPYGKVGIALTHANKGEHETALGICTGVLEKDPLFMDAYFVRGIILLDTGRPDTAREEFQRALFLDQGFVMARFYLGMCYRQSAMQEEASREFDNILGMLAGGGEMNMQFSDGFSNETLATICRTYKNESQGARRAAAG